MCFPVPSDRTHVVLTISYSTPAEVPRAVDMAHKAVANDSLNRYLTVSFWSVPSPSTLRPCIANDVDQQGAFTSPTRRRVHNVIQKLVDGMSFWSSACHCRALTVDHGDAVLT